jgi:hypothetical protein
VVVEPSGKVRVEEKVNLLPGVSDSLHLDPKLAWTAFEASVQGRQGTFVKDKPDSLQGGTGEYGLDDWAELGQRGQAFKGIDEVERRMRPANVTSEVKDQYFYKDITLGYKIELTEPTGASVDSMQLEMAKNAEGEFVVDVPGTILSTNAPKRTGNTLSWPLKYGETLEVQVSYRQMVWVATVSTVLVGLYLLYLIFAGLRALAARGKKK